MTTKICRTCLGEKPLEAFGILQRSPDGRNPYCKLCCNARVSKHALLYPEKRRASQQRYRLNHAETLQQSQAAYCLRYPERRQKTVTIYNATHRVEKSLKQALRNQAFPEIRRKICAQWRMDHPENIKADAARRRARKAGLPDTWTTNQRLFMLQYWGYACAICGNQEGLYWTLAYDHFIPIAAPACPGTVAGNMLPLCHTIRRLPQTPPGCNNAKAFKDPHTWLVDRFGIRRARQLERKIAVYFALAAEQP